MSGLEFFDRLEREAQARTDQRKVDFHDALIDAARDATKQVRRKGGAVKVPGIKLFGCSLWVTK